MNDLGSVHKSITVEASREVAFRVFTERMALWWPPEHHLGTSPLETVILEPRVGGRWAERTADGTECEWGRVLAWEPPTRLALAWQLDANFKFDPSFETELEVRFVVEGATRTRIDLEHKNLERYGEHQARVFASFDSREGWSVGLERFATAASRAALQPFLLRLIPPRPTFALDMTDKERQAMREHVVYWTRHADRGTVVVFGPVADPKGGWGVAIVRAADDAQIAKLANDDPVIGRGIGMRYEILPMQGLVVGR